MDYNLKDLGLIRIVIIDKSNPSVMDKNLFHLMNTIWWNKTLLILGRRMYIIWGKAIKYAVLIFSSNSHLTRTNVSLSVSLSVSQ